MSDDISHLTPAASALLREPEPARIKSILAERWVHYPRAGAALAALKDLLEHPRTTRMPSIAIYGDSGMGKTMIMEKFRRDHPPWFDDVARAERVHVLALQMVAKPGERRLYAQILSALGAPPAPRATVVDLEQAALRLMTALEVKVLMLDEIHNILAGSFREQRVVLNTIRYLSNELRVSLVCFGVSDAASAIRDDAQLARRFDVFPLPRWSADESFEQLVLAIVRNLPLRRPSVLSARAMRRVLQVTNGITATVFRMFNELAIQAIRSGDERITDDGVDHWRPVNDPTAEFA
jgi:hypothetical protein